MIAGRLLGIVLEDVAADAREDQAAERAGRRDRDAEQRQRSEREPDRVDRTVGGRIDGIGDPGAEVGVGLGCVRLGRRAVTEQVDPDHVRGRRLRAAP